MVRDEDRELWKALMEALDAYPVKDRRLRRLSPSEIDGVVEIVLDTLRRIGKDKHDG